MRWFFLSKVRMKFIAEIIDISFEGLGVCKHPDGYVVFCSGVIPGEVVEMETYRRFKRHAFAAPTQIIEPSEYRVKPPCSYQGTTPTKCGGCDWMHIEANHQLELKKRYVLSAFEKFKLNFDSDVIEVMGAQSALGYRNRARFVSDGSKIGFRGGHSHDVIDIEKCMVLQDNINEKLKVLRSKPLAASASYQVDEQVNIEKIQPDNQTPFQQANHEQNKKLGLWLKNTADQIQPHKILELFCGSGNLTQHLVAEGRSITAVEADSVSVRVLNEKAFQGVKGIRGTIGESWLGRLDLSEFDTLVMDPPRAGFAELSELIHKMPKLKNLVYISCDVSSYTRDIAKLQKKYKLADFKVSLLDMFPNTHHIEILSSMTLSK